MSKKTLVTIPTDNLSALQVEKTTLGVEVTSVIRTSPRAQYEELDSALFTSQHLPIVKVEVAEWLGEQAYDEEEWLDTVMPTVERNI